MDSALIEIACEITARQVREGRLDPCQVIQQLRQNFQLVTQANRTIVDRMEPGTENRTPRVTNWRRSIRKTHIVCLECGMHAKMLTTKHLRKHDLTAKAYRERYGMPRKQGLSSKETSAHRREVTQRVRPWEKAPTFIAAQKRALAQKTMGRKRARKDA